jgi:heavy metal translocating P-type ATPase
MGSDVSGCQNSDRFWSFAKECWGGRSRGRAENSKRSVLGGLQVRRKSDMPVLTTGIALLAYGGSRLLEGRSGMRERARVRALRSSRRPHSIPMEEDEALRARHYTQASFSALAMALATPLVPAFGTVTVALTIYDTLPLMRRAERSLLRGRIGNDFLSSVVCLASLGLGQILAAALQVTAFHFAHLATVRSRNLSRRVLYDVLPAPEQLRIRRGEQEFRVELKNLDASDLVVLATGDTIPVDGVVVDGEISVDQHQLTGEALPQTRTLGDTVFAGTLVTEGEAALAITEAGSKTAIARLAGLLRRSVDHTSRLQLLGEKRSDQLALPLLVGSSVALPFLGPSSATAILFSAPANAIRGTASVATSSHLAAITRAGVLIKDGRALEALAGVDTFLFDKTGTLTSADLVVTGVLSLGPWSRLEILARAAAAEAGVSHPVARALVETAQRETGCLALPELEHSRFRVGYGVIASVSGGSVLVGSRRLMAAEGLVLPGAALEVLAEAEGKGASAILVADDQQVQGVVQIEPRLRPEVYAVISALRRRGIQHIDVVSGDSKGPTRLIAESLELDDYFYDVLPQQKAELVRRLQAEGRRVCFVGDGINDALAMKQAHCSISLQGASAIASDTAQILLMDPSLAKIPPLLGAARGQQRHLKQILSFWAGYAVINTYLNVYLRIGVLPSTLFYGLSFAASYLHASVPGRRITKLGPPRSRSD